MTALRVGVIGLGVISKFYLAALAKEPAMRLTAVCDLRQAALEPFVGRVETYRDHRQMLAGSDLDAVIVNVPNDVHGLICRDALLCDVPVCVEKPLTNDLREARELTELARSRSRTLFTAFHRRYNSNVLRLRDRIAGQSPITEVTVRYLERIEEHVGDDGWYLDPQRCGGGCVADNGPNAFDVARLLVGDLRLEHAAIRRDERGVDRQASVLLRAAGGASVRVELDWSYPHGEAKDVVVRLADGRRDGADMLADYPGFKNSLWHEYQAILADFGAAVRAGADRAADGLRMVELVRETYRAETAWPVAAGVR